MKREMEMKNKVGPVHGLSVNGLHRTQRSLLELFTTRFSARRLFTAACSGYRI